MFSIAFSSVFGQDAVNRCPARAESRRNRARRLTACVHPLGQRSVLLIRRLGPTDVLPTRATRLAGRCAALSPEFQLKLCQAAGTGGMLSTAYDDLVEMNPKARPVLYGQDINPRSYALCKSDMINR